MIAIRQLLAWRDRTAAPWKPGPPRCPDCGFTDPDAERVFAHLWSHNDRRRTAR